MRIEWNRVTWYSKLAAVIIFAGTFWLAFSLGVKYEAARNATAAAEASMELSQQSGR